MRVLMISKICVIGAYQKKLEELARLEDIQLAVVVPPYWREGRSRLKLEREHVRGYELCIEPMAFNGQFHIHFYPFLWRRFRQVRPDIVHIDEEPYNLATWQAMRLAERFGAKRLFFTWQNLLRRYPFPFRVLEQHNLSHADYALAGNAEAVGVLRAKGYAGPAAVIPQFGVDPEIYHPLPERRSSPRGELRIAYLGRLVPEKGVDVLLRAAAQLGGDWQLQIVGGGPELGKLQGLAQELGIAERVNFQPRVSASQVVDYLNRCDALVLPSLTQPNWKEQFGRVLIEAMACQTPVIGSNSGEIPNVIGDAGMVFPEGDASALAACLERLRADPALREKLGAQGRARVLDSYTQARIAAQTAEVYHQL
jgi:glycosyltransferase involved in cell wall biosynthesis